MVGLARLLLDLFALDILVLLYVLEVLALLSVLEVLVLLCFLQLFLQQICEYLSVKISVSILLYWICGELPGKSSISSVSGLASALGVLDLGQIV